MSQFVRNGICIGSVSASLTILLLALPAVGAPDLTFTVRTDVRGVVVERSADGDRVLLSNEDARIDQQDAPDLPHRLVSILLPQGQMVADAVFSSRGRQIAAQGVSPTLANPSENTEGVIAYAPSKLQRGDGVFPRVTGRYLGMSYSHGYSIAQFAVYPVALEKGDVIVYPEIDIRVTTRSAQGHIVSRARERKGFRDWIENRIRAQVINPQAIGTYTHHEIPSKKMLRGFAPSSFPSLEGSPVDYVIVTNDSLAATYQLLADWKTAKGIPTVVRTTEWIDANYRNGSDLQETIRNFVIDAYSKWGITYLLIGGDTKQIPARLCYSGYGSGEFLAVDMYYGNLDGDWNADHDDIFGEHAVDAPDLAHEVYVGRLTTQSNSEALTMINKIKDYEVGVDIGYTDRFLYLGEVLFPSDWVFPDAIFVNGADECETIYVGQVQGHGMENVRMYETDYLYPGALLETLPTVIDSLNAGYNHVLHIGHGFRFNLSLATNSLIIPDAENLTNGNRQSNLYMLNCTAAAYTYSCLGEAFLRNPNGGMVSVIGANDSAYPSASRYYMIEYYRLLFNEGRVNIGQAFHDSRIPRTLFANLSDNADFWTHYIYTLLGEPEMMLYTTQAETLSVAHSASVGLGTTPITITVTDAFGAVDSAMVCLSKDDDDYQVGTTDGAGQITLNFRAESGGDITVVVTAPNHTRHETTITVNTAGAYVSLFGVTVDDDSTGGTAGNGDGVIDAGETVDLTLQVQNTGPSGSGNIDLVLRTNDLSVTILDSTASVGAVGSMSTATATDPVRITFSSTLPDEATVSFDLIVKQGGVETWQDEMKKVVHAPELALVGLRIDDTASGNGDGFVDAGEEFSLYYKFKNFGTGANPPMTASIAAIDAGFTITNSTDTYVATASFAEQENSAGFVLEQASVSVDRFLEITLIDAYGRATKDTMEFRAPSAPDSFGVDPRLGPDRLRVWWGVASPPDVPFYNVYYSTNQGGPYTLATTDPVAHSTFVHVGLAALTRHYYVVTAVDGSGNESAPSTEFDGSTNPPMLAGFPIRMSQWTASSPVVGDIDGDGDNEIVQGDDDNIYAWHHDGFEMLDGDNEPLTWGVLSGLGELFVSHPTLARIDSKPGLEIICASRSLKTIYIFDAAGDTLPGWPKVIENTIRAGIVAGDLNGDGLPEVIAVDEKGNIYVWYADGTEYRDGDNDPMTDGIFYRMGSSYHYSTPAIADIDGDGKNEIIVGSDTDSLFVFNDDGTNIPGFPYYLGNDISGSPAIGDLDGDGDLEIVVHANNGMLRALHHDASEMWARYEPVSGATTFHPSPALADIDQDGKLETFLPDNNKDLNGITYTGADLPGWPVIYTEKYTESSPIIADLDGDGWEDIILGDEDRFIKAWDRFGNMLAGFPVGTGDAMRGVPTAIDLDGDGDIELIAAGWDRNVYVWDLGGAYDRNKASWNSFHGNIHNDGYIGSEITTGISGVLFSFDVRRGRGVELMWEVPAHGGYLFDVLRAEVELAGGTPGTFDRVASSIVADYDGVVLYVDLNAEMGTGYIYRLERSEDAAEAHVSPVVYVPVTRASLGQNYPNPFNPTTEIVYFIPDGVKGMVSLAIYNVRGARVRTLYEGQGAGGKYTARWDGRDNMGSQVSTGVYFYRLVAPGFTATRKMLLLK